MFICILIRKLMDYFVASIMIANIDQYFVLGIIDQNIGILNLGFLNQLINIIPIILGIPIDAKKIGVRVLMDYSDQPESST